jgi:hypothetical protein
MRAPMGYRLVSLALLGLLIAAPAVLGACGKEIGDPCSGSADCSPNGDRICDLDPQSPDGYCTIPGRDSSTCPDEAVCVRFFSGSFTLTCETNDGCSLDELCSVSGHCVPRSSEVRFCMKTCDSSGDCRDGYECRDLQKMKDHGGEPVLSSGKPVDASSPKFCAAAPL